MASSMEFVQYVCDVLHEAGEITYRKMFGEYCLYCDKKVVGLICDNQLLIKKTKTGAALMPDCEEAAPYEGAKPYLLIESLENRSLLAQLMQETCAELPAPKPRKKSKQNKESL